MAYTVIGRIRPRPMGAWNAETEYEALDVAMQPDGAGAFMAIQNAPAGVELRNSEYWLPIVDINAAVDAAKAATELAERAAAEVRDDVDQLKDDLIHYNIYSLIDDSVTRSSASYNGITYTWNGKTCTVSGTSTDVSINPLVARTALPNGLVSGGIYPVKYKTTDARVGLNFVFYDSNGTATYIHFAKDGTLTVPSDAVEWALRLYVNKDHTLSPSAVISEIAVLNDIPFSEQLDDVNRYIFLEKSKEENIPAGLTYFDISVNYNESNQCRPADFPVNSYCVSVGKRLGDGWFDNKVDSVSYLMICLANMHNDEARNYFAIPIGCNIPLAKGHSVDGGKTVIWGDSGGSKEFKVLCIGSSFGQDSVVYAPFIMDDLTKQKISCTMGIAYSAGASIDNYNSWFDDDTTVSYFKRKMISGSWSVAESKTFKQILSDEKWDVVLLNQSAYNGGVLSTFSNLNSLINKIANYVMAQNKKGVKLGYIMPQASLTYASRYVYSDMVSCVESIMDTTPISFFIPCGTAIETARGTRLNSIGDAGGLTYDAGSGAGHLQEGLPVLLSSYVTAIKLLELCGVNDAGIMGNTIRPTADWVASHGIPGQNGASTGVTDENCILAQKCAVAAIKKPAEISVIS